MRWTRRYADLRIFCLTQEQTYPAPWSAIVNPVETTSASRRHTNVLKNGAAFSLEGDVSENAGQ
jgi:hypothetical protein